MKVLNNVFIGAIALTLGTNVALAESKLIITEIMPKPTDAQNPGTLEGMDPNGLESGWVELENISNEDVDLKDYKFIRVNRSKANKKGSYGNFPSVKIPAHTKYVFYTSERYSNSADMSVSAFATPHEKGVVPVLYGDDLKNMLVWPDKVNPKKFPFVRLIYAPEGGTEEIVDTVVIPSDLPEGASIIVTPVKENEATVRYICNAPTKGTANPSTTGLTKLGPNVGPLYEVAGGGAHDSASEFGPVATAKPNEDYEITFSLNPTMSPTVAAGFRDEDAITGIKLVYRKDLDNNTLAKVNVDLETKVNDPDDLGDTYKVKIPSSAFPATGHLIQWKFEITDASGNTWTSPSFHNPDDGYEWYGTIVEPAPVQLSENLVTWHMFAEEGVADKPGDGDSKYLMNKDSSASDYITTAHPNGARVAIYDSSTSTYYDYVRVDLRGNTTASFKKKSHGLRFAKAHPLTMTDTLTGEKIKDIRKSSLIAEWADPTFMRQMIALWLFNQNGSKTPFDFPIRVNMNGEFYQLAFHSERFTDELIEDVYGLDKFCYSYKSIGTWGAAGTAGGIEKKTPDDEKESDLSKLTPFTSILPTGVVESELDPAKYTKIVAEKMDLPSWFNYMAISRITYETDDVWANLCGYLDDPEMIEGHRGTGAWYPLGYDMNLSFGQYYHQVDCGGLSADEDWFKAHPFYGGFKVRAYKNDTKAATEGNANHAYEAIYQSEKFRRLYLRRLRTLMDKELGAPNEKETLENSTIPFIVKMKEFATLINADAEKDREVWGFAQNKIIDVWRDGNEPKTVQAGLEDLWTNYVVPRRKHLYETHSIDAENVGYGSAYAAGIPHEQSSVADLRDEFSADVIADANDGVIGIKILNGNNETIDLSGWEVSGPVNMTLPAGTVIDQKIGNKDGELFVVIDRRQYVKDNTLTLTDEVIVGNAEVGDAESPIGLTSPEGLNVFSTEPSDQEKYLRLWGFAGAPKWDTDKNEFIIIANINQEAALDVSGVRIHFEKTNESKGRCNFVLPEGTIIEAGGLLRLAQADVPWEKITDGVQDIVLRAANSMVIEQYIGLDQATIIGGKGSGNMAVHNLETGEWYAILITDSPGYVPPPRAPVILVW